MIINHGRRQEALPGTWCRLSAATYEYYDTSPLHHLQTLGTQLRDEVEEVEITGNTYNKQYALRNIISQQLFLISIFWLRQELKKSQ